LSGEIPPSASIPASAARNSSGAAADWTVTSSK